MSNPLLRPNDPRFQRPPITDSEGQNRFAEQRADAAREKSADGDGIFASPEPGAGGASYSPVYVSTQPSRSRWAWWLAAASLAAGFAATTSILLQKWYAIPLAPIGLVFGAVSCYVAVEDLSALRKGLIAAERRMGLRYALGTAAIGTVLGLAQTVAVVWLFKILSGD